MIRPIVAYGSPVLKKKAENISEEYPNLSKLLEDMWETMYASNGVGLAAPQIGLSLRIFIAFIDYKFLFRFEGVQFHSIMVRTQTHQT